MSYAIIRKGPTELRALAREIITGQSFLVPIEYLQMSAGLILMGMLEQMSPHERQVFAETIGAVVGDPEHVMGRMVNGFPMLTRARFVHINDVDTFFENLVQMREALA